MGKRIDIDLLENIFFQIVELREQAKEIPAPKFKKWVDKKMGLRIVAFPAKATKVDFEKLKRAFKKAA